MTNEWRISLFAGIAERIGTRTLRESWPETRLLASDVKSRLMTRFPEQADLIAVSFIARNQAFAHDHDIVELGDELALLPPVSGGSEDAGTDEESVAESRYTIVEGPIDTGAVIEQASHPDHGAALAFVGTTREWTAGKRTVKLEYEAYVPMAKSALRRIGDEIADRWPGTLTAICHRIGVVGVGESSVVIAVSSPHRASAYESSRYAIERLKQTVPIWKKEVYEDGTEWKGHQTGPWNPHADIEGGDERDSGTGSGL
ncbi:molybdenum cofactor biosynthesis protein MoaE [Cohnella faecalis]|uniref:molybdenum cofactor biosynthesis protein n=1 Tax=Cohnella faecalis TaxID=2315694 RepID=UPI00360BB709